MNSPRRWHGKTFSDYLPEQPIPETLDWDCWLATAAQHKYNVGYINGEWRSWFDFGNGALGDWGAHIFDTAHEFLDLGMPTEVEPTLEGHSQFIFPQASTLAFRFPKRGALPPVELTWYDGVKNLPPLPDNLGESVVDGNIPPPSKGTIDTKKRPPGKVIYGEGLTFKGGSHGATLQIVGEAKAKDMASKLPSVPKSPSNHFANFLKAAKGEEKTRWPARSARRWPSASLPSRSTPRCSSTARPNRSPITRSRTNCSTAHLRARTGSNTTSCEPLMAGDDVRSL
jgi:hypothetical protein